jgi:hypothetical protein
LQVFNTNPVAEMVDALEQGDIPILVLMGVQGSTPCRGLATGFIGFSGAGRPISMTENNNQQRGAKPLIFFIKNKEEMK